MLLVTAPFVRPFFDYYGKTYGKEIARPKTRKQVSHWKDYQRFLTWSRALKKREKGFYRISYVRPYNDHYFGAAPVYNKTPMYKVGYTPAINFKHKPDTADPRLYELLNVKYVVTIGGLGGSDYKLEKRFGPISVYRFTRYKTDRLTLEGPGKVRVETFDPAGAGITVKVSGASESSRLILHVANYPNWKASVDGNRLPIESGVLAGKKMWISVPAKNGTIEFRYGMPAVNILGSLISWLGIAVLLLMVVHRYRSKRVAPLVKRLAPLGARAERFWGGVGRRRAFGAGGWLGAQRQKEKEAARERVDRSA
jgi:hypothetical protein